MERIIGYETSKMFRFNCYSESADGKRICEFQVHGNGDKNEMIRLHNTLLNNGFHISGVESANKTIPIMERC